MPQKEKRDIRSIYIFTEKFSEGEWHQFRVLKMIQIPGEETYYVLESKAGNRLLMPSKFYKTYCINFDDTIQCHVDKINCSGKIYLEPEHPQYKTGRQYFFKLQGKEEFIDRKGRLQAYYDLTGHDGMKVQAMLEGFPVQSYPVQISAKLVGIRKGILILNEIEVINNC
jgi:hypothetical protein